MLVLQFGSIRQSLTFFSSILLGVVILASCTFGGSFESYMASGKAALAKKDYNAAVIQFKNAAQKNPTDAEVRYLLATAYIETGNFPAAEKELRQAKQFKFDAARTSGALGKALLLQAKYHEVLDEIQPDPSYPPLPLAEILTTRGLAYLSITQLVEARDSLGQAKKLAPEMASVELGLVQVLAAENKLSEAEAMNNQLLAKYPAYALAWGVQGDLLAAQRRLDQAVAAYKKAIELEPQYFMAHIKLASLFADTNQLPKAQSQIEEIKKIAPSHPLTQQLQARIHYLQSNYPAAEEAIQSALKADPNYPPSLLLAGAIAHARGSNEQAEKYVSGVVSQFPNHLYARKLLATIQLKLGRTQNALATLQPILNQSSPDIGSLLLAGEAYRTKGEFVRAAEYLERAAALDPNNASVHTGLGMNRLAAGDTERAAAEFTSASQLKPGEQKADFLLVQTHLMGKQYDKALEAILSLEKKQPNNPEIQFLRGLAYAGKGDLPNARVNFERALSLQPTFYFAARALAQLDLKDGNAPAARKRFETILEADKNNLPALVALANLAANQGQEKDYVAWLERAAKSHPTALSPRAYLAHFYMRKREPAKALSVAREARSADPKNPLALHLLATMQFAVGDKENAITSYTELIRMTPEWPLVYYDLAAVQLANNNAPAAKASLNKALEIDPTYLNAKVALVRLELQAGKPTEALQIAQQIQKQTPKSPLGFILEGDARMALSKFSEAATAYEKALGIAKDGILAVKIHRARSLAGDSSKADAELLKWIADHPRDAAARGHLAQTYMASGKNKAAIEQYEFLLQKNPDNGALLNNLALLYQNEKDPRALATAERASKLNPQNSAILDTLGWILVEQGQLGRGLEVLQIAAAGAPGEPSINYHYAVALAKSGDKQKARKQLETLLNAGKNFPQEEQAKALLRQL